MVEAKLLRKKLKNGLIVDKWDLVTIIEKQQAEIEELKAELKGWNLAWCEANPPNPVKELTNEEIDSIWAEMSEQCDEEFIDMKQFARAILRKATENELL